MPARKRTSKSTRVKRKAPSKPKRAARRPARAPRRESIPTFQASSAPATMWPAPPPVFTPAAPVPKKETEDQPRGPSWRLVGLAAGVIAAIILVLVVARLIGP